MDIYDILFYVILGIMFLAALYWYTIGLTRSVLMARDVEWVTWLSDKHSLELKDIPPLCYSELRKEQL